MEKVEDKSLSRRVDGILKNRDILALRTKLNALEASKKEDILVKKTQDLERYETIVNYFLEKDEKGNYVHLNRVREVPQNRKYLVNVRYDIIKCIVPIKLHNDATKNKESNYIKVNNLYSKITEILDENSNANLQETFMNSDLEDEIY